MRDTYRGRAAQRLVDDAIPLGEAQQRGYLIFRSIGVEIEPQPDVGEADRRIASDRQRAPKVEIALDGDRPPAYGNIDRCRDG